MAPGNQAAKCPRARIKDDGARSSEEPRETTDPTLFRWLNGLRGLAAFLVYWHHHQLWAHDRGLASVMEFAYGFRGQYYFATLTGVRTFFTGGHFAVAVLFTVSGFASSIAPLAACHRGDHARVADVVSSAIARRWFRLYIPLAVTTFAYMCLWYLPGAGPLVRPEWASHSWFDESATWCREFASYSFALGDLTDPWFRYNDHLWSAVLELRGSVLVYLTVLVLAKCTSKTRLGVLLGLMVYFVFIVDGWYCAMFLCGTALCEMGLIRSDPQGQPRPGHGPNPLRRAAFTVLLFGAAVYLGNVPHVVWQSLRKMPGWYYLSFIGTGAFSDIKWFYLFFASLLLIICVMRHRRLQRLLETRVLQYLGRIAFALHLVHGPVLWMLGQPLYRAMGLQGSQASDPSDLLRWSTSGVAGLEPGFLAAQAVLLPLTMAVAHLTTVFVDEPTARILKSVYRDLTIRQQVKP